MEEFDHLEFQEHTFIGKKAILHFTLLILMGIMAF